MKYIEIKHANECCGCRACENVCPKNAITMETNEEGFLYPKIDKEKCINCGLCKSICPWINDVQRSNFLDAPICYASKAVSKDIQKNSSSGGMFRILAEYILKNNGVVVGAKMDNDFKVKLAIIRDLDSLKSLVGSKYVSCDTGNVFREIKRDLEEGLYVLFSGLPCHIAGLKNYLRKNYDNLITAEVICHGVPSQMAFDKYIEYLEKKNDAKVIDFQFRSKKAASWGTYKALCTFDKNGKAFTKKINADFDPYYWSFLYSKNCRESCYACRFANQKRNADFTMGDFWGIEKLMPEMVDYDGVSVLVLNSKKAMEVFENIKSGIEYKEIDYALVCKNNGQLLHPSYRPEERDNWYKILDQRGYDGVAIDKNLRSYIKIIFPQKLKFKIKKYLKKR